MFQSTTESIRNYPLWKTEKSGFSDAGLHNQLLDLKIIVNLKTGNLFYAADFIPLALTFDLVFVRHGETFGNCGQTTSVATIDNIAVRLGIKDREKRIYQGNVDTEINQLTDLGKKQAATSAKKLQSTLLSKGWQPDMIFSSPLTRAQDTAQPFVQENGFENRYMIHRGIKEMSFGAWDNRRVCDFAATNPCHSFYLKQHALVKQSGRNGNQQFQEAECFCELILRAACVLNDLNKHFANKKIIMFSHSMFGAACQILLGQGSANYPEKYLAFDGKSAAGFSYTLPNAEPVIFNMNK